MADCDWPALEAKPAEDCFYSAHNFHVTLLPWQLVLPDHCPSYSTSKRAADWLVKVSWSELPAINSPKRKIDVEFFNLKYPLKMFGSKYRSCHL